MDKLFTIITFSIITFYSLSPLGAQRLVITDSNYKRISSQQPVLIFVYTDCDMGNYAADLFEGALPDLEGVKIGRIEAKHAGSVFQNKNWDTGTIGVLKDGRMLYSSEDAGLAWHERKGFNNLRRIIRSVLTSLNIPFEMEKDRPDFLRPDPNGTSVNYRKRMTAHFRFNNGLKNEITDSETGARADRPVYRVINGALYGNGKYNPGKIARISPLTNSKQSDGFAIAFSLRLEQTEKYNVFGSINSGLLDIFVKDNRIGINYEGIDRDQTFHTVADSFFLLKKAKVEPKQWNSLVLSFDANRKRIRVLLNGRRLDDINISDRMADNYKSKQAQRFWFHQYRRGDLLHGYADEFAFFEKPLTGSEMIAFHNDFGRSDSSVDTTDTTDNEPALPDREKWNQTLLQAAAEGDAATVEYAIEQGADVNAKHKGWTGLLYAAYYGHTDVVEVLLEKNADAMIEIQGWSPFRLAEFKGHSKIVTLLDNELNTERYYFEREVNEPKPRSILNPADPGKLPESEKKKWWQLF